MTEWQLGGETRVVPRTTYTEDFASMFGLGITFEPLWSTGDGTDVIDRTLFEIRGNENNYVKVQRRPGLGRLQLEVRFNGVSEYAYFFQ